MQTPGFLGVGFGRGNLPRIANLIEGEAAGRAGLLPGDVIHRVDDEDVATVDAVINVIGHRCAGDLVNVTVERGGSLRTVSVRLGVREEARRLTGGRGVDVVYDSVGADTFEGSLGSLRPRGLCVLFGQSSGPVPRFELQRLNQLGSLFVTRPSLAHYTRDRAELELRAGAVLGAVASGALEIEIGAEFALAEAADAHRALEGRKTTGKLLLRPG